ncbi:FIST N-terminal domain-containing protein [Spirosoma sp.]|uniref:FIST signal transduction protein n=1 Tax=Spirosoma sp. TaxID=1899569 RepID=UPI002629CDC7|nr:FIST N-terminal domain-containing protein [Spirosoma sp.]MCX6218609.1 FIST C-terminal domain-containing protein [Spirosoma sp.]
MKIKQELFTGTSWKTLSEADGFKASASQLVLAFGERILLSNTDVYGQLRDRYPAAAIVINSTAGEIFSDHVADNTIVATAITFDKTTVRTVQIDIENYQESYRAGQKIAEALDDPALAALFIVSDGSWVNGSKLIDALNDSLHRVVPITGGLAGDATRFASTLVGLNEPPATGKIVGIGFYGDSLCVGTSSMGGWDVYGPEREVTRSEYNVLFQIGDTLALDLYQDYLGKYAEGLPSAALFFPLSMRTTADSPPLVRTILSIDEAARSMTFAGDMPEKSLVRFMTANLDRIIEAAATAAHTAMSALAPTPELVILVSCVGRKLVLGQRTDEEVEAVRDVFGEATVLSGFYSYGEIAPTAPGARCELHNQTMTITAFSEQ